MAGTVLVVHSEALVARLRGTQGTQLYTSVSQDHIVDTAASKSLAQISLSEDLADDRL